MKLKRWNKRALDIMGTIPLLILLIVGLGVASYYGVFTNLGGGSGTTVNNYLGGASDWSSSWADNVTDILLTDFSWTNNGTSSGGASIQGVTFIVNQNGSNTDVWFGENNTLFDSDIDASLAFESMMTSGSKWSAVVKNGVYDFSTMATYLNSAGKDIVLIGESWDQTVFLDSRVGATATFNTPASSSPTANLTVKNIKFDRRVPSDAAGKYCIGGSYYKLDVDHCQFVGNTVLAEGTDHYLTGAVIADWASDYFVNCYFRNNRVVDFQYGVTSASSTYSEITGNYFENAHTQAVGIQVPLPNGNYIIQNNFLNNCAEWDEGIAFDSVNPAIAINVNGLVTGNLVYNDALHDPVKPICIVTTSGIRIADNKILTLGTTDADWWGQISVDSRDYTEITNVTIENNDIWTMQHEGIQIRGLSSGSVSGNVIKMGYAAEVYGMRFTYSKAITYAGTTVNIEGNKIYTNTASSSRHGILFAATAGTGAIHFYVENNFIESFVGIETDYDSLFTVSVGSSNLFVCTSEVVNSGSSAALYAPQEMYTYLVSTDGTNYYLKNETTNRVEYSSTNASAVTNYASGSGTYSNVAIVLKAGTYLMENDTVLGNNTVFRGENKYSVVLVNARVGMVSGYTNGLIRNYGMGGDLSIDQNITVSDLTIDGQRSSGKVGFGIAFEDVRYVMVKDVIVRDVAADAINFNGFTVNQGGRGQVVGHASNVLIENINGLDQGVDCVAVNNATDVRIYNVVSYRHGSRTDINGHGLTLSQCERVQVDNFVACNSTGRVSTAVGSGGLQLNGVRDSQFSNIYCSYNNGSGIYASDSGTYNCYRNTFTNIHVEYNAFYGMYFNNPDGSVFSNLEVISNSQDANNTYAGVYWVGAQDIVFSNARLGDVQTVKTQAVGMNETGTSDRNIFSLINARDNWQAGIITIGAATHTNHCWNLTSWVA